MILTSFIAVVPAAGIGQRMQSELPKQYLELNGKSVLEHTLSIFDRHPAIGKIIVVLHPDDQRFAKLDLRLSTPLETVIGGAERYDSVVCGLKAVPSNQWVLVHDAARPCVRLEDISQLIQSLDRFESGAILATAVRETMKRSQANQCIAQTVERDQLWHAQTPQLFQSQTLTEAIESALAKGYKLTDEAQAMELSGHRVGLVECSDDNLKITRPNDLSLAQFYLDKQQDDKHA